jgi:predicted NBD/HSP70 family sugar kinase
MAKANEEFELSAKTIRQVRRLVRETGKPGGRVIGEAVELYDKGRAAVEGEGLDEAEELSPELHDLFKGIMKHIGRKASKKMTPDERLARAKAGAKGRAEALTAEERKAQAKKAAVARWGKSSKARDAD